MKYKKIKNILSVLILVIISNILFFTQFSCKAQNCNTLFINDIEVSKIQFLKINCPSNKKVIESISYTDSTIDSMKISIIRSNGMVAESFLCNDVGVNIDIDDTYVNDLEILISIASNMDLLSFTIFKKKEKIYIYIPLIVNDNCH
ncbi:hypothetical protein ACE193_17285 [Bernardetia sp. OM2101]|uniref:hypothetical protein n=1 Tax=Bernardetia sp. OM2101 TaxID=3344876 RepID=UPI0035CF0A71